MEAKNENENFVEQDAAEEKSRTFEIKMTIVVVECDLNNNDMVEEYIRELFRRDGEMEVVQIAAKEGNAPKGLYSSDNAIYISKAPFSDCWDVFKTIKRGINATQVFSFETEEQAMKAGRKIADAIGGKFYGTTDPRK